MRLAAALSRFEVQLRADGRSPHTIAQYARHMRRFGAWIDAEHLPDDVAQLEPEHVARFPAQDPFSSVLWNGNSAADQGATIANSTALPNAAPAGAFVDSIQG